MAKSETEGEQKGTSSAEVILNFEDGTQRKYKISGTVFADLDAGAVEIRNDNGSRFVFLPNPEFHSGKRKRRLLRLYSLKP